MMGVLETVIFAMVIGMGFLAMSFKRDAFMWSTIACIIFMVTAISGLSAPISVDSSGMVVPTTANYTLCGLSLVFLVIGMMKTVTLAFEGFGK